MPPSPPMTRSLANSASSDQADSATFRGAVRTRFACGTDVGGHGSSERIVEILRDR